MRAANLLDSIVGSSRQRRFLRSVEVKSVLIASLSLELKACIIAALLCGRVTSVPRFLSSAGSRLAGLELPSAAFFAYVSMAWYPADGEVGKVMHV